MTKAKPKPSGDLTEDALILRHKMLSDPAFIRRDLLKYHAWSKQEEILNSVKHNKRTAVRSCHGIGKTATAAVAVLEFMLEGPCRVVTTAPTWAQVEQLLWREIAMRHKNIQPAFGNLFKTSLEVAPDWFALGLSTDTPERFQGHHANRMLLVVDEASGVDEAIYNAAEGFLTAEGARILLIGNPTRTTGTFYRAFKPDSGWNRIHISALDSPNFTGEKVPDDVARALVTQEWVMDARRQWGEESPQYKIRVLGEFAETTGRQFFQFLDNAEPVDPFMRGSIIGTPASGGILRFIENNAGLLKIWDVPQKEHKYIVFADVAGQVSEDQFMTRIQHSDSTNGDDYSCAMVLDVNTGKIVAEYHGRPALDDYAEDLARISHFFNKALLAVERNGPGQAILIQLTKLYNYPNLYRPMRIDSTRPDLDNKYGWLTSTNTRPRMLSALQTTLRDDPSSIPSETLIDEMKTFVYNRQGRETADNGCHDDRVIAAAGAFAIYQERNTQKITLRAPTRMKVTRSTISRAPRVG